MKRPTTASVALAATLLAILVPTAGATTEGLVPPGNSAVTQYTESLPTPRGHRDTDRGDKKRHRSPEEALGARNARQLEAQGPDGRAAAAAAAETAPSTAPPASDGEEEAAAAPPTGNSRGGDGGAGAGKSPGGDNAGAPGDREAVRASVQIEEPSGSSGIVEALGEATGSSSSGQMGWLLPLLIFATALWALAYALRQRRRVS